MSVKLFLCILSLSTPWIQALRHYTSHDMLRLRTEVRDMFQHAYDGYLKHASDYDELRPLSCDGQQTWGSYSLTLIDALDTLAVMGNFTEFRRVVDLLVAQSNFDSDINVSVFETNIRIVGGLLSAHLLSKRAGLDLEPGWPCNGPLLRMAEDVARRLLPAFDTKTGMPYGTVNLKYGVPQSETSVTCTACIATFIVEFGAISRLTGDPVYEEVAMNAIMALYQHRSPIGLYGNHIDVQTGRWTAHDAGIGAGVDSYYEYLVKGAIMLNRPELMKIFNEGRLAIDKYLKRDDWHVWVSMNKGQVTLPVFQSLEAYWPGVLSLVGDISSAMKTLHNYHLVWRQYGFLPEFYNIPNAEAGANRENYPLRPELIESVMYLYRATGDPFLLEVGEDMLRSIQHSARTACGYATIKNVRDHRKEDRMESFFLAETTKYLYLLFDPDNFLHNDGGHGHVIETSGGGECVIEAGGYIFNTEAHPIDPAALRCCHEMPRLDLLASYNRKDYVGEVFQISIDAEEVDEVPVEGAAVAVEENSSTFNFTANLAAARANVEATKQKLISEILNLITHKKRSDSEDLSTVNQPENDDIIMPMTKAENDSGGSEVKGDLEHQVEIIKTAQLPDLEADENSSILTTTRQKDDLNDSTSHRLGEDEQGEQEEQDEEQDATEESLPSYFDKEILAQPDENSTSIKNNSIISDFVQAILKTATPDTSRSMKKFDPQKLLDRIRRMDLKSNVTNLGETDYKLLSCKAQPYLQRLSVMGEFF